MRKIPLIFFLTYTVLLHAQQAKFEWAKQLQGTDVRNTTGQAIAIDASGNVYSAGIFTGTVDFDPGPGVYNLSAFGIEDVFISKLDSAGNFIWAKHFGGNEPAVARARAIAVDASGNVYTTGEFAEGTIDFDPGPGVFNLTSQWSCFVSKLDADGNFIWTKQLGESSKGTSIAVDDAGNVFTAGIFLGISDFDPGPGVFNLGRFAQKIFISKLNADGDFVWAKQMGGLDSLQNMDYGIADNVYLGLDRSGNIYISGSFFGEKHDFDPGPGYAILTAFNYVGRDFFVCKLDASGNFVWVRQMGGSDNNLVVSMTIDNSGNIYTCGNFTGTTDFDPGPGTFNLTAVNNFSNIFISKIDANGNFIWAKQLGGSTQLCYSIAIDNTGGVYTTGYFGGTLDFDPGTGTTDLTAAGYDVFVLKLDESGDFIWATQTGGSGAVLSNAITADIQGNVYTTGSLSGGSVDFDPGTGTYNLSSGAGSDIFVYKLGQCQNSSSAITLSTCRAYTLNGETYDASGVYTQTLTNAKGCDSIITLNLTINLIHSDINVNACKSFTQNNHVYSTSGTYIDTFVSANGCDSIVTLHLAISPAIRSTISASICVGQSFEGHTSGGSHTDSFITANGCDSIRTLQLVVMPGPFPYLGADTSLCAGDSLVLYPGEFATYRWQDGSSLNRITITKPGLYSVVVTDSCGTAGDEIMIEEGVCDIYFPSAFTPNNDGRNDVFKILGAADISDYHLVVYNRWGQLVFETTDPATGWNGSIKSQRQNTGVYAWRCSFKRAGNARYMKGTVILLK